MKVDGTQGAYLPPRPFPWHRSQWAILANRLLGRRFPSAILFHGAADAGIDEFVHALSALLLCASPNEQVACGACKPCLSMASAVHGDFLEVRPVEASRVLKVDQVRAAIAFSHKTPAYGVRKVIVLNPADSMNIQASNALLKSLEESGDNTIWMLACRGLYGVPATVRSRCHLVRLSRPDANTALDWLSGLVGDKAKAASILELAYGRPVLAYRLHQSGEDVALQKRRAALQLLLRGEEHGSRTGSLWGDAPVEHFAEELVLELQSALAAITPGELRGSQGRAIIELLDEAYSLLRAIRSGANPGRQLLEDVLLSKSHNLLGASGRDDTIA